MYLSRCLKLWQNAVDWRCRKWSQGRDSVIAAVRRTSKRSRQARGPAIVQVSRYTWISDLNRPYWFTFDKNYHLKIIDFQSVDLYGRSFKRFLIVVRPLCVMMIKRTLRLMDCCTIHCKKTASPIIIDILSDFYLLSTFGCYS